MTKKANLCSLLLIGVLYVLGSVGCSKPEQAAPNGMAEETAASAPVQSTPDWLLRGGDINRASMMSEWAALTEDDRLASSADLVTMQMRHAKQPMPDMSEFESLSRKLEAKLSEISTEGTRNNEYVGNDVVDVWPTIQ